MRKKGRMPSFVALSRRMLASAEWRSLTPIAKDVYICIKYKYVGYNNGQIRLYYSELASTYAPATICRVFKELEEKGWIERIKIGNGTRRWIYDIKLTGTYDNAFI